MTPEQRATLERLTVYLDDEWSTDEEKARADALRAALGTCGTCAHAEVLESQDGMAFCAAPVGEPSRFPLRYRSMPLGERCTGWTSQDANRLASRASQTIQSTQ